MKTKIKMQFDPDIAAVVGVDCAIMHSNIDFWVDHNRRHALNEREGSFWTYNSARDFVELFPFWTEKQVRRILRTLVEKGYLLRGNFNKKGYDRTGWYTLPNEQLPVPKREDETAQMVTPIPDNKQDIKTQILPDGTEQAPTPKSDVITEHQLPDNRGKTYILRVLSIYKDLFRNKYGFDPQIAIPRVSKLIKDLAGRYTEFQIAALLIVFFNWAGMTGGDQFEADKLTKAANPFGWFYSSITQYEVYLRNIHHLEFDNPDAVRKFVIDYFLSLKK